MTRIRTQKPVKDPRDMTAGERKDRRYTFHLPEVPCHQVATVYRTHMDNFPLLFTTIGAVSGKMTDVRTLPVAEEWAIT